MDECFLPIKNRKFQGHSSQMQIKLWESFKSISTRLIQIGEKEDTGKARLPNAISSGILEQQPCSGTRRVTLYDHRRSIPRTSVCPFSENIPEWHNMLRK